jgi:hypothetical protein
MNRGLSTLFLLLFAALLVFGSMVIFTLREPALVTAELRLMSVGKLAGYLIVVFSALAMLISVLQDRGLNSAVMCIFPLLGGMMLVSYHWVHPLVLVILAVVMITFEFIRSLLDRQKKPVSPAQEAPQPAPEPAPLEQGREF